MIISVPGQKAAGAATEALVEFVDIYPTLTELCRLAPPGNLEGTSFVPLLTEPGRAWKSAAFSIYPKTISGAGKGIGRALRTDRYRLVEWAADESEKRLYELYDRRTDPQENVNIATRAENQELLRELAAQLHDGWQDARSRP